MHTLKRLVFLISILLLLFSGWFYYYVSIPIQLPKVPYEFSIKSGSSLTNVGKQLAELDILPNTWSFVLLSRVMGYDSSLKAGNYKLSKNISPVQLLDIITIGDVNINQVKIRFIEGWTFRQFRKELNNHVSIQHDTLRLSDQDILKLIGANETAAEGLFFPDTYYFSEGTSDITILKRAYNIMHNKLTVAWAKANKNLPFDTPYKALILASIIEKETGKNTDRNKISGVLINRLRSNMLLQTDPTVIYGIGEKFDGNLSKKDLQKDHQYNTYIRPGLPPTPIAMPGLSSIKAALNPEKTKALYFVSKGNGESHFSNTLKEHNRAVAKYQRKKK
ncbi:MAG: aminodeoxychorismate lyase [Nitrosomonadaceae bacterium]|nr:aminodeoxychorismate lyase [Nitrosomonadaceae bacterium]|tara:strand:- start:531 stop:1532 length:1002 start_codon:yes stop_codon:yes gene_type:complete